MNCQREGSNLKVDIRIALQVLGRDPHIKLPNGISDLRQMRKELHGEWREKKLSEAGG